MLKPSDYHYLLSNQRFKNDPSNKDTTIKWPRSDDGLYSPSRKVIDQLSTQLQEYRPPVSTALIYDSEQARREGVEASVKYDEEFWKRVRLHQDKLNYQRRQKRSHLNAIKNAKIFREARLLAHNYYVYQKMHAFSYLRQQFVIQLEAAWKHFFKKQKEERLFYLKNIQAENHFITKLYEDYYQPINNKTKIAKHPMLHETRYKRKFINELESRLRHLKKFFLAKQNTEKRLYFLWTLDYHNITMIEKSTLRKVQDTQKNDIYVRNFR